MSTPETASSVSRGLETLVRTALSSGATIAGGRSLLADLDPAVLPAGSVSTASSPPAPADGPASRIQRRRDGTGAFRFAAALASQGTRAVAFLNESELSRSLETVARLVRTRTPIVGIISVESDWTPLLDAGRSGAVVLAADAIEEVPALLIAAQVVAESTLLPTFLAVDSGQILRGIGPISSISDEAIHSLLPQRRRPSTPAQELLFGEQRPAVPSWLDADHPMGVGLQDTTPTSVASRSLIDDDLEIRVDSALAFVGDALGIPLSAAKLPSGRGPLLIGVGSVAGALRTGIPKRTRAGRLTRIAPFPLAEVRLAEQAGPAALLATGTNAAAWLSVGVASGLPVGICAPSLRKGDIAAAAAFAQSDTVPDLFFLGAWRPQNRAPLPESQRRQQKVASAYPELAQHLLQGDSDTRDAEGLFAVSGPQADRVVEALTGATGMRAAHFARDGADWWIVAAPGVDLMLARAGNAAADASGIAALFPALAPGARIILTEARTEVGPSAAEIVREAGHTVRASLAGAGLMGASVAALRNALDETQRQAWVDRWVRLAVASGEIAEADVDGIIDTLPSSDAGEPIDLSTDRQLLEGPHEVERVRDSNETAFDLAHFWRTHGFLYRAGRAGEAFPDPHRSVSALPAGASAASHQRDPALALPVLTPEQCTACGICWSVCPEGAISARFVPFHKLVARSFDMLKAGGGSAFQLERVASAWTKEASRLLHDAAPGSPETLSALMSEALQHLLARGGMPEDRAQSIQTEYAALAPHIPPISLATTHESDDLAFAIDPDRCTACGACVAACPETALQPEELSPERRGTARAAVRLLETISGENAEEAPVARLLNSRARDAVSGGSWPASLQATIRIAAAAAESVVSPGLDALASRARALSGDLGAAAQAVLEGAVRVNDFAAFSDKLTELGEHPAPEAILHAAGSDALASKSARLRALATAQAEMDAMATRLAEGAHGTGRARVIGLFDEQALPGPLRYPDNPFGFPWLCSESSALGETAEGIAGKQFAEAKAILDAISRAEACLKDRPRATAEIAAEEVLAVSPALLLITDRLSADLLGLLEDPASRVRILLLSSDPLHAIAEPALAAAAIGSAFVAQSTLGNATHCVASLLEGFMHPGPTLFHLFAPPAPAADFVGRAARAIDARVFPLFVYRPAPEGLAAGTMDLSGNPSPDQLLGPLDPATWALEDPAARYELRGSASPGPDAELARARLASGDTGPALVKFGGRSLAVPDELMHAALRRLRIWRRIGLFGQATLAAAGADNVSTDAGADEASSGDGASAAGEPPQAVPADALKRLTERLLALSGFGPGSAAGTTTLREHAEEPL